MNKHGKRFAVTLLALGCVVLGGAMGWQPAYFTALGLIISVYVGGQSATDWKGKP